MALLDLYNTALGVAGARAKLATIADKSREAEQCAIHYPNVRKMAFSLAFWPSLSATKRLSKVAETDLEREWQDGDPPSGWSFSYALPSDYVKAREIAPGLVPPNIRAVQGMPPFALGRRGEELVLHTNSDPAILTYTSVVVNVELWEAELYNLVVAGLADAIAGPLGADASTLARVRANYQNVFVTARTGQANHEHQQVPEQYPDWLGARNGMAGYENSLAYPLGLRAPWSAFPEGNN